MEAKLNVPRARRQEAVVSSEQKEQHHKPLHFSVID